MDEAPRRLGALLRNLAAGFGLLWPRRVRPELFFRGFDQLFFLLVVNLIVWAGLDRLHAEPGAELQLDGLFGWASYLVVGICGAALIARLQSPQADTRSLLIPALSAAPFLMVLMWLLSDFPGVRAAPLLAVIFALIYLIFVGLRVLKASYGFVRLRVALCAVALIIASPFILDSFGLDTRLWLVNDEQEQAQDEDTADAEGLFYDQPARIAAAVSRIPVQSQEQAAVYFLGFAGVGEQSVFRRESLFAEQVFADRFGSGERSVELINDQEDRDTYPLATVSGLDQAVRLLSSRMNTDEDVLVLMLTSHGSQDGLAVSNGTLPMRQLGPDDLQQVLEASGIKWRVIIVSACYAGVFLEPLKSETTLVITASDATHSSFGCDDSRDLTWFGEAFLRDSLPHAQTLEDAFKKAAELVRSREIAAHEIPSNPQISMGAKIRDKLAAIRSGAPLPPPVPRTPSNGARTALVTIAPCPKPNRKGIACRLRS